MPFVAKPEVLAPAGDMEALRAAVRAGADAVYFGLRGMNARARAANFDVEELASTMRFLHEHDVRGFVTLNTLLFDAELPEAEAAIVACAEAGVDAIIVQDLAVAKLARAIAPTLPVHASTQMTCTDAGSALFAKELGASRVVLARELSVAEVDAIRREAAIDVEVFVHGALCVSYSGQCLTSEAIGGRSANRGACAQACRLPYDLVVDGEIADTGERAYLLSPEDLEASALVPELARAGVSSLKIEGRLKGPEYVAATTRLYRAAVDAVAGEGAPPTADDRALAEQAFSRGSGPGFLRGVDHQRLVEGRSCDHRGPAVGELLRVEQVAGRHVLVARTSAPIARGDGLLVEGGRAGEGEIGGRVWSVAVSGEDVERAPAGATVSIWLGPSGAPPRAPAGRRIFRTSDPTLERRAEAAVAARRIPIDVRVEGEIGRPFVLVARTSRGRVATVAGDAVLEHARSHPLTGDVLRDKLGRLGDTPFELRSLETALPPDAIAPLSALNRARRALVSALADASRSAHPTTAARGEGVIAGARPPARSPARGGLFVLCRNVAQAEAALDGGADGVYLDFLELTGTGEALRHLRARGALVGVAPPRVRKPGEEKIDRYMRGLAPDALLVRGLGALRELASAEHLTAIGDASLNVTNRVTAAEVLGRGHAAFTPSFDLDGAQLLAMLDAAFAPWAEIVVHHPMALFHMEHCVFAALLSRGSDYKTCGRPCESRAVALRDRAGMDHPVEADVGCRNTVFHAKPQSAVHLLPQLVERGVRRFRVELVRESPADAARLVRVYRGVLDAPARAASAWRELRTERGYGVVRGSLRVVA